MLAISTSAGQILAVGEIRLFSACLVNSAGGVRARRGGAVMAAGGEAGHQRGNQSGAPASACCVAYVWHILSALKFTNGSTQSRNRRPRAASISCRSARLGILTRFPCGAAANNYSPSAASQRQKYHRESGISRPNNVRPPPPREKHNAKR